MGNLKIKKRIFLIIAILTLLLTGISSLTSSYSSTEAAGICSDVGSFMGRTSVGDSVSQVASQDETNRKWTVEELFKNSVAHSSFYGEGPGTWVFAEKLNRGESHSEWSDDAQSRINDSRSGICLLGGMDWSIHIFTWIANVLTGFTGSVVMFLIGRDAMGDTLASIVGGDGTSEGLIGTFLSSFYMPLIVLTVIIMVGTLIYKGLIQMKLREALGAILWSFGAFIVGVTLMLQPQLLASAPQAATSTITTCVLGALSGQNCLSGEVTTPSMLAGKECLSSVSGGLVSDSETVVNSMNCTIWKSFVLEPWAEQQFGAPYNELYTENIPPGGSPWENLPEGEEGSKYCVSLTSSDSYANSVKGTPVMDGEGVCNVALYHLFIKTNMKDTNYQLGNNYDDTGVQITDDTGKYDSRWYDIILPMAKDESKWRNWSGDGMYFSKLGTSIMSLVAIVASSTVLLTLAIFGGAYKVIGVILMAFAPIFLLFAIEPTKGKRIFLGWLETLVSSILKYFAITVLIVVALVMYAGLLSNTTGVTSLVGIIIMTVALHMYRKEIVDLIGASNMGGERLSNKVNEVGEKVGKRAKDTAVAVAGGAIGGAMGTNKARVERVKARKETIKDLQSKLNNATTQEEKDFFSSEIEKEETEKYKESGSIKEVLTGKNVKDNLKGMMRGQAQKAGGGFKGSWDSTKRSMKRGTGIAANTFQQLDRTKKEIQVNDAKDRSEAQANRKAFEDSLDKRREVPIPEKDNTTEQVVEETSTEKERNVAINAVRDTQRGEVKYEGDLSDVEKDALDKFADRLSNNSISDDELTEMANNEEVMSNPNKRSLVANEINARIKTNSMMNVGSHALGRTGLANEYLSQDELKLNLEMHAENYLETGNEAELQKYLAAGKEFAGRTTREFDVDDTEAKMRQVKAKVGNNYKRRDNIPKEEELKGKVDYEVLLSNNEKIDTGNVETPAILKGESKKEKVSDAKRLNQKVLEEREEQIRKESENSNPLPDVDELDNEEGTQPKQKKNKQRQQEESTPLPDIDELEDVKNDSNGEQKEPEQQDRYERPEQKESEQSGRYEQPEQKEKYEEPKQRQPESRQKETERPEQREPEQSERYEQSEQRQPESRQRETERPEQRKPEQSERYEQPEQKEQKGPESRQERSQQPEQRQERSQQPEQRQERSQQPEQRQERSQQPEPKEPEQRQERSQQPDKKEPEQRQERSQQPDKKEPESRQEKSQQSKQKDPEQKEPKQREDKQKSRKERSESTVIQDVDDDMNVIDESLEELIRTENEIEGYFDDNDEGNK